MRIDKAFQCLCVSGLLLGFFLSCLKASDIRFTDLFFQDQRITVEIAETFRKRELGLMHRHRLGQGMGMLFVFRDSDYRSFWMKNTLIELDIIYIDSGKRIVDIHRKVPPCQADPCPSYPSNSPARYVLELDGGEAERLGMKAGDQVDFILPAGTAVQ